MYRNGITSIRSLVTSVSGHFEVQSARKFGVRTFKKAEVTRDRSDRES